MEYFDLKVHINGDTDVSGSAAEVLKYLISILADREPAIESCFGSSHDRKSNPSQLVPLIMS